MSFSVAVDVPPMDGTSCGMGGSYGCILERQEAQASAPVIPKFIPAPLPDLAVSPAGIHVASVGNQVVVEVQNVGDADAAPFEVRLYNRDPATRVPLLMASQQVATGLPAGATVSIPLSSSTSLSDPIVRVDEAGQVAETDEIGNNQASIATWTIQSPTSYVGTILRPDGDVTITSGGSLSLVTGSSLLLAPGARLNVESGGSLYLRDSAMAPMQAGQPYLATVHGALTFDHANVTGITSGLRFTGNQSTITSSTFSSVASSPALAIESGNATLTDNQFRNGDGSGLLVSGNAVVTSLRDGFQGNLATAIDARGGVLSLSDTLVQGSATGLALTGGAYVTLTDSTISPSTGPRAPATTVGIQNDGGILYATNTTVSATTTLRGSQGSLSFQAGSLQGTQLLDATGTLVVQAHGTQTSGTRSAAGSARMTADWPVTLHALSPAPDSFVIPFAKIQARDATGTLVWNGTTDEQGNVTLTLPEYRQTGAGSATLTPYTIRAQHNGAPLNYTLAVTAPASLTVRPPVLADLAVVDAAPAYDAGQGRLWARIRNLEPASALNVTIQFQIDGTAVGQTTLAWAPGSGMVDASIPRPTMTPGIHTLTVSIDPLDSLAETTRTNNVLSRQAWVVTGTESCTGSQSLNGTLQVLPGGWLNLNACTLSLGGNTPLPTAVEVESGATLNLTNGSIMRAAAGSLPYEAHVEGNLQVDHSTVSDTTGIVAQAATIQLHQATLGNTLGTFLVAQDSTVSVSGSTVQGGNLSAGLSLTGGAVTLQGNTFTGFGGDAVSLQDLATATVQGNRFTSSGSAYTLTNVTATFQDEVIAPSVAHSFVVYVSHPTLLNVTHDFNTVWQGQGSTVRVAWHVRAGIQGTDNEKGRGTITVIDRFGQWVKQANTQSNGWTPDLQLTQFIATDTSGDGKTDLSNERQVFTPYTLMAGANQVSYPVAGNGDALVPQTYAPKLRTSYGYFEGNPSASFAFPVQAYDTGNGNDTMTFALSGVTMGWTASLNRTTATAPQDGYAPFTVQFTAPNQYNAVGFVNVTATAENGAQSPILRLSAKTGANTIPTALFNAQTGVAYRGDAIPFQDTSRDTDGWIANWTWSFGDGATSYERNPSHAYSTLGTKTVQLTVTDNGGAIVSTTGTVQIVNRRPSIPDGSLTPAAVTTTGTVTYTAVYRDVDGDAPTYVRVLVDGQAYTMTTTSTMPVTQGRAYQVQVTDLAAGGHSYHFEASDGQDTARFPNGFDAAGPQVNNPPSLTNPAVSPASGTASTVFRYRVIYTDSNGDPPQSVNAVVDSGSPIALMREQAGNQSYMTGVAFITDQLLAEGSHSVVFTASDGQDTTTSSTVQGPTVLGASPLQAPTVSPSGGVPGTTFTFRVTYHEPGGLAPDSVTLILDGQSSAMTQESNSGGAYVYHASPTISTSGRHTYYIEATRSGSTYRLPTSGSLQGPIVNALPVASLAAIASGNVDSTFTADASSSTDTETASGSLETRVTWGDGGQSVWARQLTRTHHYAHPGTYQVTLEVRDLDGGISQATRDVSVIDAAPTAVFTVTPTVGNAAEGTALATTFTYLAGNSGDLEDQWDSLHTRWDWEGDGTWDTPWQNITGKATHVYSYAGAYAPKLAVQDSKGQITTVSHNVTVEGIRLMTLGSTVTGTLVEAGHKQIWKVVLPPTPIGSLPPHNMEASMTFPFLGGVNFDLYGQKDVVPNTSNCFNPCRASVSTQTGGTERVCWSLPSPGTYYLVVVAQGLAGSPVSYQLSDKAAVVEARVDLAQCVTRI